MFKNELIVPVITPRLDGEIDLAGLKKLTESLITKKVTGLFVLGTNGEFQYLTPQQKQLVLETIFETNVDRLPLYVGISADTLSETADLITLAEAHKAAALVYTPQYGKGTVAEKTDEVFAKSTTPILLYNNQHITEGEKIPLSYVAELAENDRVVGVKDSSGDMEYLNALIAMKSDTFAVLHGEERNALSAMDAGVDGLVSGSSNMLPEVFLTFLEKPTEETFAAIQEIHKAVETLDPNYIKGIKMKLVEAGIIGSSAMWM